MSGYREIRREDRSNFKKLDHSVKNVFKWRCLEEKDHHTFLIKNMRKVNVPGKFFCNIYKALLSFESTTKKNRNHIALMKLRKTNTTLISSFHTNSLETLTNGAAPSVHKEHVCAIKKENLLKKIVSFED